MSQQVEALADKIIKNFALKDIIKHKSYPYKNLFEISSLYPNQGVNFKFWRKTWPQNSYWIVKDINFKNPQTGKAFGILFWEGQQQNQVPVLIRGGNKRGTWRYDINNAEAILDNGLVYSAAQLQAYKNNLFISQKQQNTQENEKQE